MAELTICMNVYNGDGYLQTSIGSVRNQTLQDFKILVYDDGSTDNTVQVLESFNDPRISVIRGNENKGVLYARSKLIPMIDTEYCMWLDDDDFFCRNDALERALAVIKSENYDLVSFARMNYIDRENHSYVVGGVDEPNDFMYFGDKLFEMHCPVENNRMLASKIMKSELLKKCVPGDEILQKRYVADAMFFIGLLYFHAKRYCHLVSEEPIYSYNYDIGVFGSRMKDDSAEYFNGKCEYRYDVVKHTCESIKKERPLTDAEKNNVLKMANLENLCRTIRILRNEKDMEHARELAAVWHNWFCLDGYYVLNDYEEIENVSYCTSLENLIYG